MPETHDFSLGDPNEYDPGEAWYSTLASSEYERLEESWQEDYASSLTSQEEANAKDYYEGFYRFIDEIAWRMKNATMAAFHRGEWKEQ